MTAFEAAYLEAIPTGLGREVPRPARDLCLVLRTEVDTGRETKMLDALERANRRAIQAWLASGRTL